MYPHWSLRTSVLLCNACIFHCFKSCFGACNRTIAANHHVPVQWSLCLLIILYVQYLHWRLKANVRAAVQYLHIPWHRELFNWSMHQNCSLKPPCPSAVKSLPTTYLTSLTLCYTTLTEGWGRMCRCAISAYSMASSIFSSFLVGGWQWWPLLEHVHCLLFFKFYLLQLLHADKEGVTLPK